MRARFTFTYITPHTFLYELIMELLRNRRRLLIFIICSFSITLLLGGGWAGHRKYTQYQRYYVPGIPASNSHLPSRVPPAEHWASCREDRYKYNHPEPPKPDETKCHPLLEHAFVDPQIHPPLPRPGYSCTGDTKCPIEWVTMSTSCNLNLNRMAMSAFRAGIPLTVLGYHKGWVGWGHRMRMLHDYLLTVPDDRLIIFTDATDVILAPACSAADILSAYKDADVPVLFSGEVACWPRGDIAVNYTTLPGWHDWDKTHFHFLNAGLSIGTAGMLPPSLLIDTPRLLTIQLLLGMRKALISKIYAHDCYDDQLYAL